jgi:DNA-binding CsgD family transcriptional regulator
VLALVAEGRTNRQIGQAVSITPPDRQHPRLKDPGQAGVAGRGEAAAVAHRPGLDKP